MKKNVLMIVVDCLGADYAYHDKGTAHTPHINKLREDGFCFYNTIASTSTTTPNFATILTGMYPIENGVRSHSYFSLSEEIITFPELLKYHGYNTYAEVSGPLLPEMGLNRGFTGYHYRERHNTLFFSKFGEKLLHRIKNDYKQPWFIMVHIWALHSPRPVYNKFSGEKFGKCQYSKVLSGIDNYIGRLLKETEKYNPMVVFTGDHGEIPEGRTVARLKGTKMDTRGDGVFYNHGFGIYEALVRVPLVFRDESIRPGQVDSQVRQIDIFPTVYDLLGLTRARLVEKNSLKRYIRKGANAHRDAFLEATGVFVPDRKDWYCGLRRNNQWKLIYNPSKVDDEELYNLKDDSGEKNNLAERNKNVVSDLKNETKSYMVESEDEEPEKRDDKKILEMLKSLGYV